MPLQAPVAFPLHPIIDGACGCGSPGCARVGKHPAARWRDLKLGDAVPLPAPGAGAGIKTGAAPRGSGVIVVDLDGPEAVAAWLALGPSPDTFTVRTPRGAHLYFQHPGFPVRNSAGDLAPGVDVRGDGGFVVAPGSPHRSGATYELVVDLAPAPAPAWLLDWLRARPAAPETQDYPGDVTEPAERARRRDTYARYLADAEPCVSGRGGDQRLFEVVQYGAYDLALPTEDVLELVEDVFDPRCDPPWGAELASRVTHKAHDAKTKSTRPRQVPLPADPVLERIFLEAPDPAALPTLTTAERAAASLTPEDDLGESWGGWDKVLPPPVYLLEGLIPEAKVITFFAEGGSVKTWSAVDLAIAHAMGRRWLGSYAVTKGRALYLDYEDGPYEFSRRVRLLSGGVDVPDLGYLYSGPQIDKPAFWMKLAKHAQAKGITLLVCDSLGAAMPGNADENTTAFAEGMKLAGRFTEVGCTVVFVHHANKSGGMRGTSAIRDQSDVVFMFEPVSETDDVKRMRMICDKPGPQRKPLPVNIELAEVPSGGVVLRTFVDEAAQAGRNAVAPVDRETALRLALKSAELSGQVIASRGDLVAKANLRRQDGLDALKEMIAKGEIAETRDGLILDSDDRRRRRVFDLLDRDDLVCRTEADIARHADVTSRFVDELRLEGVLFKSAEGRWFRKR